MNSILFSLPASFEAYQGLGNFMHAHGLKQQMFEIVDEAISAWMSAFLESEEKERSLVLDGYQWKSVFLPHGTTLRNVYKRASYLAHVEGRELLYDGSSMSPAQFVNAVGGSFRNAWTTLWIRFPNETEWKPAMSLRKKPGDLRGNKSE